MSPSTATTPRGRQETVAALVEACERLCSTTPPSLISIRDVAPEAGVTPGLVHHYFESKDALIVATLKAIASDADAAAAAGATHDPVEMARTVWRQFEERPAFAYIIAWWLLEGRNVTEAMGGHPFIRRLSLALSAGGAPLSEPSSRSPRRPRPPESGILTEDRALGQSGPTLHRLRSGPPGTKMTGHLR